MPLSRLQNAALQIVSHVSLLDAITLSWLGYQTLRGVQAFSPNLHQNSFFFLKSGGKCLCITFFSLVRMSSL